MRLRIDHLTNDEEKAYRVFMRDILRRKKRIQTRLAYEQMTPWQKREHHYRGQENILIVALWFFGVMFLFMLALCVWGGLHMFGVLK